jgi:hypothetical protein
LLGSYGTALLGLQNTMASQLHFGKTPFSSSSTPSVTHESTRHSSHHCQNPLLPVWGLDRQRSLLSNSWVTSSVWVRGSPLMILILPGACVASSVRVCGSPPMILVLLGAWVTGVRAGAWVSADNPDPAGCVGRRLCTGAWVSANDTDPAGCMGRRLCVSEFVGLWLHWVLRSRPA